ncbi:MAG TPA: protein phosphatase 2C domain-containing protein [Thermoanaerobaculia bacterium]|nr:protein phosphatase 2C domain-containing protein [Thermoanaerobaculia bacterium]
MNDTRPIRLPGAAPRPVDLPPDLADVRFDAAGATDRGKQRARNEDAFAVEPLRGRDGLLLVVCDGLGGAHGGEVASRIAVDVVVDELARRPLPADRTLRLALRRAVERASQALDETAKARPELAHFGTTLTAALLSWPEMWIAHVGDSRAYLWRGGRLERLTRDHTMAERLREEGLVGRRQKVPTWESVLWNALGPSGEEAQLEERHERLEPGDRLLLCSDGLTRHLPDDELARRLAQRASSQELCAELVAAANRAGGEDNITAVAARAAAAA